MQMHFHNHKGTLMKRIIFFIFITNIYCNLFSMELEPKKVSYPQLVDFVLIFEGGGNKSYLSRAFDKEYTPDAIMISFFDALEQNQLLIVSSPILKIIFSSFTQTDEQALIFNHKLNQFVRKAEYLRNIINTITLNYSIRLNSAHDYAVLVPNKLLSKGETFTSLGFNEKNLKPFEHSDQLPTETLINIENFKTCFSFNTNKKYIFYITGHGTSRIVAEYTTSYFAQLNLEQFKSLLTFINPVTDLLFMGTCYAGGSNIADLQRKQIAETKEYFALENLQFILIMGATTDHTTYGNYTDFVTFFNELHNYFKTKRLIHLKRALEIDFKIDKLWNIPSIRFPGSNSFFRAIELDKDIEILTVTSLKAFELIAKKKGHAPLPYKISANIATLLYPALIATPLNFIIKEPLQARIISMINGNALHILTAMDVNVSFEQMITIFTQPETSLEKAFFIKNLYSADAHLENVFFHMVNEKKTVFFKVIGGTNEYKEWSGKYVKKTFLKNKPENIVLNEHQALKEIASLVRTSAPTATALSQATGGQQTVAMLFDYMQSILTSVDANKLKEYPEEVEITINDLERYQKNKKGNFELTNIKKILIAPALISLPLKISYPDLSRKEIKDVQILSSIKGDAIIIFDDLTIDLTIDQCIEAFKEETKFEKVIFIRKLHCTSGMFENVLFPVNLNDDTIIIFKIISLHEKLENLHNLYYKDTLNTLGYGDWEKIKSISKEDALQEIEKKLTSVVPNSQAIAKTTRGKQTKEMVEKFIFEILKQKL